MKFKVGDFVRVKETTHDEKMPENRHGLIVEEVLPPSQPNRAGFTSIWRVLMTNGTTLKFHEMFLEHFTSS